MSKVPKLDLSGARMPEYCMDCTLQPNPLVRSVNSLLGESRLDCMLSAQNMLVCASLTEELRKGEAKTLLCGGSAPQLYVAT